MKTYDYDWVIAALKQPGKLWHLWATITYLIIGIVGKIVLGLLNTTRVHNRDKFMEVMEQRPSGTPIITVANHYSCIDDPAIWCALPLRFSCNVRVMRWSLAAHNILFTNHRHTTLAYFGKCIPVVRGEGVYQPAINTCIDKLKQGEWVHIFPEGKVNESQEHMRLKWGVGRMVYDSPKLPIVVPIWHIGFEDVLPNEPPYNRLKRGNRITINFGNPIDFSDTLAVIKNTKANDVEARRLITDKIQEELAVMRKQTELLHSHLK